MKKITVPEQQKHLLIFYTNFIQKEIFSYWLSGIMRSLPEKGELGVNFRP
jgi:hypothetical protein